jgi:hypothetical protein
MMEKTTAYISVFNNPGGIKSIYACCRVIVREGRYAITILISEDSFVVDHNPAILCCSSKRSVPLLFDNLTEAEKAVSGILQVFESANGIGGIVLLQHDLSRSKGLH